MKLEINLSDEDHTRIKTIQETRTKFVKLFEELKGEPKNNDQLSKINETITLGDNEINFILLKAIYENKSWQTDKERIII